MKILYTKKLEKSPFEEKKVRGRKADGLRYEARVAESLREYFDGRYEVVHGPWIAYAATEDGERWESVCQPDVLLISDDRIIIIEVKLSSRRGPEKKLKELYGPCVQKLYGKKVSYVQIYKNIGKSKASPVATSFSRINRLDIGEYCEILWRD